MTTYHEKDSALHTFPSPSSRDESTNTSSPPPFPENPFHENLGGKEFQEGGIRISALLYRRWRLDIEEGTADALRIPHPRVLSVTSDLAYVLQLLRSWKRNVDLDLHRRSPWGRILDRAIDFCDGRLQKVRAKETKAVPRGTPAAVPEGGVDADTIYQGPDSPELRAYEEEQAGYQREWEAEELLLSWEDKCSKLWTTRPREELTSFIDTIEKAVEFCEREAAAPPSGAPSQRREGVKKKWEEMKDVAADYLKERLAEPQRFDSPLPPLQDLKPQPAPETQNSRARASRGWTFLSEDPSNQAQPLRLRLATLPWVPGGGVKIWEDRGNTQAEWQTSFPGAISILLSRRKSSGVSQFFVDFCERTAAALQEIVTRSSTPSPSEMKDQFRPKTPVPRGTPEGGGEEEEKKAANEPQAPDPKAPSPRSEDHDRLMARGEEKDQLPGLFSGLLPGLLSGPFSGSDLPPTSSPCTCPSCERERVSDPSWGTDPPSGVVGGAKIDFSASIPATASHSFEALLGLARTELARLLLHPNVSMPENVRRAFAKKSDEIGRAYAAKLEANESRCPSCSSLRVGLDKKRTWGPGEADYYCRNCGHLWTGKSVWRQKSESEHVVADEAARREALPPCPKCSSPEVSLQKAAKWHPHRTDLVCQTCGNLWSTEADPEPADTKTKTWITLQNPDGSTRELGSRRMDIDWSYGSNAPNVFYGNERRWRARREAAAQGSSPLPPPSTKTEVAETRLPLIPTLAEFLKRNPVENVAPSEPEALDRDVLLSQDAVDVAKRVRKERIETGFLEKDLRHLFDEFLRKGGVVPVEDRLLPAFYGSRKDLEFWTWMGEDHVRRFIGAYLKEGNTLWPGTPVGEYVISEDGRSLVSPKTPSIPVPPPQDEHAFAPSTDLPPLPDTPAAVPPVVRTPSLRIPSDPLVDPVLKELDTMRYQVLSGQVQVFSVGREATGKGATLSISYTHLPGQGDSFETHICSPKSQVSTSSQPHEPHLNGLVAEENVISRGGSNGSKVEGFSWDAPWVSED